MNEIIIKHAHLGKTKENISGKIKSRQRVV